MLCGTVVYGIKHYVWSDSRTMLVVSFWRSRNPPPPHGYETSWVGLHCKPTATLISPPRYLRPATILVQAISLLQSCITSHHSTRSSTIGNLQFPQPTSRQHTKPSNCLVPKRGIVFPLRPSHHSPWIHLLFMHAHIFVTSTSFCVPYLCVLLHVAVLILYILVACYSIYLY